ncbi:hypothetical protein E2P86_05250 [Sphingobacterium psychroaquaticum]|uniref:hypothetical protein n=1 Tax=Sphingobacterium psychroaquaticum TaxID=561061 RepID=UPI00106906F3|nr:hypothetical protein [Sphingobacterium psychroaquaticum]QBQ40588.1 hypothetical protein E2P86_05250 [Sphingobacterium psychroaquaticum]
MKKIIYTAVLFITLLHLTSCNDLDILAPPGPAGMSAYKEWVKAVEGGQIQWSQGTDLPNFFKFLKGEKGDKGDDGKSSYDIWKDYIASGAVDDPHNPGSKWPAGKNTQADFYKFMTGAKGDAGLTPHVNDKGNWQIGDKDTGIPAKGKDGTVITIGTNGNWVIDGKDSGISAKGKDGKDGTVITIGSNGNWFIDGKDTGRPSKGDPGPAGPAGKPGTVITIGGNGNWFIDGADSGKPSVGKDGSKVTIGGNGNWHIDGVDTGVPTKGKDGVDGKDGSVITINAIGNWVIDGVDTGVKAEGLNGAPGPAGKPGSVITISSTTGNWEIDGVDTGNPSKGTDGSNGVDGSKVKINDAGNWEIDGTDTGLPARGEKGDTGSPGPAGPAGQDGTDGVSAYSMWVEAVKDGEIFDKQNNPWPPTETDLDDFWKYLSGESAPGVPIEITPLSFVKNAIDPADNTKEIFEFNTEEGAKVTIIYKGQKYTQTAGPDGKVFFSLVNDVEKDIPILASAKSDNKLESSNYLLNVPARPAVFEFGEEAVFVVKFPGVPPTIGNGAVEHPNFPGMVVGTYEVTRPDYITANFDPGITSEIYIPTRRKCTRHCCFRRGIFVIPNSGRKSR